MGKRHCYVPNSTDTMQPEISESFSRIRPYCVRLMQEQSADALEKLKGQLRNINKSTLSDLSQYILFPFRVILKKTDSHKDDFWVAYCDCLLEVFKYSYISEWSLTSELLVEFSVLISDKYDKKFEASGSEELKLAVVRILCVLFRHALRPLWNSLYNSTNIPLLGHIVTLLLSIAKSNVSRKLRLEAIETLMMLCRPEYSDKMSEKEQSLLSVATGNIMASFLPGISTALSKILSNDQTARHKIKSATLALLSAVIVIVLGDQNLKLVETSENNKAKEENGKLSSLLVTRDEIWVSNVGEKLKPVVASALSASNSDEWSVRLSALEFCNTLLTECSDSLKSSANALLTVIIKLLNDDYKEISEGSSQILESYSAKLGSGSANSKMLVEILEENLFVLCSDLPKVMRRSSDEEKLSNLKVFLGYLTLMKEKLNQLLYSPPHLKKMTDVLLHCLELDTSGVYLLEQVSATNFSEKQVDINERAASFSFRKQFRHFRDDHIQRILYSICMKLGKHGDSDLLVDHFVEVYSNSESNCKQAVLVLIGVLTGIGSNVSHQDNLKPLVQMLLDEFLSNENWYLVTSYRSEYFHTHHQTRSRKFSECTTVAKGGRGDQATYDEISQKALKSNVLMCCLHLEAILTMSKLLAKDFQTHMMDVLYPLLEKTMDDDSAVATYATSVLKGVALNCGYQTSSEMIAANSDYLISTISIQLMHPELFPRCPVVLQAMLDHSHSDMLAVVSDTIDEILKALDLQHLNPSKLLIFIPVLLAVVKAVHRWTPEEESVAETTSCTSKAARILNTEFVADLRKELMDFHRNRQIAELEMDAEIDPNWEPNKEQVEELQMDDSVWKDEKKKVPLGVQITSKVLSRCIHIVAHGNPRVRMRVMDVVVVGVKVLKSHENELLPMAHKLWSPLVSRFSDKELQVVMTAFETLCMLGRCSKDFLRKRFSKEVLPRVLSVLKTQAKESAALSSRLTLHVKVPGKKIKEVRTSDSLSYYQSVAFKMQSKALKELGPLLINMDIGRSDHLVVCKACSQYLSSRQPNQLQDLAIKLFEKLATIDEDSTWLFLTSLWCPESVLEPPREWKRHPLGLQFTDIHLGGDTDFQSEYRKNVSKLLNTLVR